MSWESLSSNDDGDIPDDPDYLVNADAQTKLRATLRMAEQSRGVADWLFADDDNAFHKNTILPPNAFENTMSIEISQNFTKSKLSPDPRAAFTLDMIDSENLHDTTSSVSLHVMFLPVKTIDGVDVGYSFCMGQSVFEKKSNPFFPSIAPDVAGRFAFDKEHQEFITVVNASSSEATMIITHAWRKRIFRDRAIFCIPRGNYDYDNLPSSILTMFTNTEFRLSCPKFEFCDEKLNDTEREKPLVELKNMPYSPKSPGSGVDELWAGVLNAVPPQSAFEGVDDALDLCMDVDGVGMIDDDNLSVPNTYAQATTINAQGDVECVVPHGPEWINAKYIEEGFRYPKSSVKIRSGGKQSSSGGGFGLRDMRDSLGDIEKTLKGTFYGPKIRRDVICPSTGDVVMRVSGEIRALFLSSDPKHSRSLQEIAVQSYYAAVLSAVTDQRLTDRQTRRDLLSQSSYYEDDIYKEYVLGKDGPLDGSQPLKRPRTCQIANLAPRPHPYPSAAAPVPNRAIPPPKEEIDLVAEREAKLEAKRRKNRLSAARSNQKRKEKWEAQKKELEELRQRVEELTARKGTLTEENQTLKLEVQRRGENGGG